MEYHVTRAMLPMLFLLVLITSCNGHGGLLEPPMRSIAWRYGFDTPINYDWNSLYCGGFFKFQQSGGNCGLCGDPFDGPIENDRGGAYDTGLIVRHYPAGLRQVEVKFELTAYHKGYVTFHLCPNNQMTLTQACFDSFPLQMVEGSPNDPYKFYPPKDPKMHEVKIILPQGVICDRCVLQWIYKAGNSHGRHENGTSCVGCGLQETFVNCADISIGGTVDNIPVRNDTIPPEPTIVIPQTPDVTQIIDNAPADSFEAVMRALRGIQQFAEMGFNVPGANVPEAAAVQDSGIVENRRGTGDLPGITPEQINVPRQDPIGAVRPLRRGSPGLTPTRSIARDLSGITADHVRSIGSFGQTNLFQGNPTGIGGMSIFGDPNANSRRRMKVDLPRPNSFNTVIEINLQDRRFNSVSGPVPSNQNTQNNVNQRQTVQNGTPPRSQITPFTLMVNPNIDPSRRSPNDRLIPITFTKDPRRQSKSVPDRTGFQLRRPSEMSSNPTVHNLPNPLERSNVPRSMISSISDTVKKLPKIRPNLQAGRSIFASNNHGIPPRNSQPFDLRSLQTSGRNSQSPLTNAQTISNSNSNAVVPPNEFVAQMTRLRQAFPNPGAWVRGDGMASPREAVRQATHLDTRDFSTSEIRQRVPQLPRDIGIRQDGSPLMERRHQQGRGNWFPNTQSFVQGRRMRTHTDGLRRRNGQSSSFSLPRRIEVGSMTVAQHLLRKYPQLRGRVFLSRRAHLRNKYAHMTNQYARRRTSGQNA